MKPMIFHMNSAEKEREYMIDFTLSTCFSNIDEHSKVETKTRSKSYSCCGIVGSFEGLRFCWIVHLFPFNLQLVLFKSNFIKFG
jgi:hypothetical protein